MTEKKRGKLLLFFLLIFLPLVFFLGLFLGSEKIDFAKIMSDKFAKIIVLKIRLPRTLLALLCGALLAGSGAVFQGFFRSPLADSSMLGVSSGGAFGAALVSSFGASFSSFSGNFLTFGAFLGAMVSVFCVFLISSSKSANREPMRLLLAGTAISVFFSAMNQSLLLIRDKELYKMTMWTLGSFNGKGFNELKIILLPSIVSFVLMFFCIKPLDIIASGNQTAATLGLNTKKTQVLCFVTGSLAAATAVCAGGIIGFVGLICPHIVRLISGSSYKKILPLSFLFGACFLCLVDIFCRILANPIEIPIGIITSILGAPFFIFILVKNKRQVL